MANTLVMHQAHSRPFAPPAPNVCIPFWSRVRSRVDEERLNFFSNRDSMRADQIWTPSISCSARSPI
jgi:hypothetical protein